MAYNFASSAYHSNFGDLPNADGVQLRKDTAQYIRTFDRSTWHDSPMRSLLHGAPILSSENALMVDTVDAFLRVNGKQLLSPESDVDAIISHVQQMSRTVPSRTDWRKECREIDLLFHTELAPTIIGNQCMDFEKQDGIMEIEESIQVNAIEQRLNDALLADESAGKVAIHRDPVFVGCVSNFSNFLDLSRKVLRHIEVGVPVVVFSRSNTGQHMYRWSVLLLALMKNKAVDLNLVRLLFDDILSSLPPTHPPTHLPPSSHTTTTRSVIFRVRLRSSDA